MLAFEAVRQVQALTFLVGVEQHQADIGAAFNIGQAQQLAALEHERGVAAAGQRFFKQGGAQGCWNSHAEAPCCSGVAS